MSQSDNNHSDNDIIPSEVESLSSDFSDSDGEGKKKTKKQKIAKKNVPTATATASTTKVAKKNANTKKEATKLTAKTATTTTTSKPTLPSKTATTTTSKPDIKTAKPSALPKSATEADVKNFILSYLNEQNRPYTGLQIFENLHQAVPKAKLLQLLDKLVESDLLCRKPFNKTMIYYPKQGDATLSNEELSLLDDRIAELTENIGIEKVQSKTYSNEITSFEHQMSTESALEQIPILEAKLNSRKQKLQSLQSSTVAAVSSEDLNLIYLNYSNAFKEWKKRRRACFDMIDMALEDMKVKKEAWMEDNGIETDESAKVKFADFNSYYDKEVSPKVSKFPKPVKGKK